VKTSTAKKPQSNPRVRPTPHEKSDLAPFEHDGLPVPELKDSIYYCNWHYSVFRPDDELEDLVQCFDELSYYMQAWDSEKRLDEKKFSHLVSYLADRLESVKKALSHYHQVPDDLIKSTDLEKLLKEYSKGGAA
jgi:hypothetical protein